MSSKPGNPLKSILQPYIFVLKEGQKIKKDFLDYSLMMLYVHSSETIRSPSNDECRYIEIQPPKPKKRK